MKKKYKGLYPEKRHPHVYAYSVISEEYDMDGNVIFQRCIAVTKHYMKAIGIAYNEIEALISLSRKDVEEEKDYFVNLPITIDGKPYSNTREPFNVTDGTIIRYHYINKGQHPKYKKGETVNAAIKILFTKEEDQANYTWDRII